MARTCLVCGGPAGSAEHIFPASLGGRRTNKGIYCTAHNNGYSDLAARLTEQLEFFNAQLGVVHDRTRKVRPARMTEVATGQALRMTDQRLSFAVPDTVEPGEHQLAFTSKAEAEAWRERQRAKGIEVTFGEATEPTEYHPGTTRTHIELGGAEGLRAIGYVGQTFLACAFPAIARSKAVQPFIRHTYCGEGDARVWWDFDAPALEPASPFAFGHRIVVGVDAVARVAYARISLFSAFDYAMTFGPVDQANSVARIYDIDPLAPHAPADLIETAVSRPPRAPEPPPSQAEALRRELESGGATSRFEGLQRRIMDRERALASDRLFAQIAAMYQTAAPDHAGAYDRLVAAERQRIFSMLQTIVASFAQNPASRALEGLGVDVPGLVRSDPSAPDGLSSTARQAIDRACHSMARTLQHEFEAGRLDAARVRELIADGPGHALVLEAALAPHLAKLQSVGRGRT